MRLSQVRFKARLMMVVVVILALTGCGITDELPDSASVCQLTFGPGPWPGLTILQAQGWSFRDNASCFLRFKASPAALAALTPGFTPITREEYLTSGGQGGPPWWNPLGDNPTIFQKSATFHSSYAQGHATLAYSPTLQIANLEWNGVD